jgi:hypothetical protein
MTRAAALALLFASALLPATPATAREAASLTVAQARYDEDVPTRPLRRARTRIEVTPARPPHRECVSWLEREFRPSGTVIVPRLGCWWAR